MQTFMPYPSFAESARVLDRMRLGKQRVEAWQIVQALTVASYGWKHHPAVKMWRGRVPALACYGLAMCAEWSGRGYADSLAERFASLADSSAPLPAWVGDQAFHAAHRSKLLEKLPTWYEQWGWSEETTKHRPPTFDHPCEERAQPLEQTRQGTQSERAE
jgi:hypothetical protein